MHAPPIPAPRTRLIGRDAELARLAELVNGSDGRIVTVVGAGGCGKTRLAIEAARHATCSFPDGAAFVNLSDLRHPEAVVTEIVRALGLADAPAVDPATRLIAGLCKLRLLLVLDGFEQLVSAAPMIGEVAAHCPDVAWLITSRRRLNVTGERILPLAPLADEASVELFCERAVAANPHFEAVGSGLQRVGEICRLVDHLPLAIELVAPRVTLLPLEAMLARLQGSDDALTILDGGPVDTAHRHRSLGDTIRWSCDLLSPTAARLLPRLAVFHDGWTLAAMEAFCCDDGLCEDVGFDALVELVDMHLVEPVELCGRDARFRMLETVRRFAIETLRRTASVEPVLERHADHFVAFATRAGRDLQGPRERSMAALIDQELPNIRAALRHCSKVDRTGDGLAAATALGPYWLDWGSLREGREWLDCFLASSGGSAQLRAAADGWSVRLAIEQGETSIGAHDCHDRLVRARQVLDRPGDLPDWLRLTDHLSHSLRLDRQFDLADEYLVDAIERCRSIETAWLHAELLLRRVVIARDRRDVHAVRELVEQTTRVARAAQHERVHARAMTNLALGDPSMPSSRAEVERGYKLCQEVGDQRGAAMNAAAAAVLALDDGDSTSAASWFLACLDIGVTGYWQAVAWGVMGVAGLAVRSEHLDEAARLHEAILLHVDVIRRQTPPVWRDGYDRVVVALRDRLGEDFEAGYAGGDERGWPAAVDLARRIADDLSRAAQSPRPTRSTHRRRGPRANPELTDRELDVLRELVVGRTNQKIADRLGLSAKTVMHHTGSVYRKLGVRGRAEAVAHALRLQLVAS